MRKHSAYLFGIGLALPMLALVAGLQVPIVAASPQNPTTDINRTLKGDRMQTVPSKSRNAVNGPLEIKAPQSPAALPELLDGCEPVISSIGQTPLAKIAGRCVS